MGRSRRHDGPTAVELLGALIVAGSIVAVLAINGPAIAAALGGRICDLAGLGCARHSDDDAATAANGARGAPTVRASARGARAQRLNRRVVALAAIARTGGTFSHLYRRGLAAFARGDLRAADAALDRLAAYGRLVRTRPGGWLVARLSARSDGAYAALVARGDLALAGGRVHRRYGRAARRPGGSVVVHRAPGREVIVDRSLGRCVVTRTAALRGGGTGCRRSGPTCHRS